MGIMRQRDKRDKLKEEERSFSHTKRECEVNSGLIVWHLFG